MSESPQLRISANQAWLEQLLSVFEHLDDGVFVVRVVDGPDFVFDAFNRKAAEWVGVPGEDVRGRRVADVMPAGDVARILAVYQRCFESGEAQRYDEVLSMQQPLMTFQTTLVPACDEQGRVTRIVGVARDVTEQRRAARALLESQEMLATAFRHAPYAMLILRAADDVFVDVNVAFEQLFECERAEVIENRAAESSIWADPSERSRLVELVKRSGGVQDFGAKLRTFKGDLRDVLISSDNVLLDGQPHIIANVRDVTLSLDADRTKAELETQLRQAQKLESLGTLAGGIAHDFNNILGAMVAFIDLIRLDAQDPPAVLEHVAQLKSASMRARDLVQQILTFSRAQQPSRSVTQVSFPVRDAVKLLRSSLPASVGIQSSFDPDAPQVLADASQLHQVIMNLGTNAAHAMRERGGELSLNVDLCVVGEEMVKRRPELRPGRYARIVVKDSGHGMDAPTLKRSFEPFFTTKKQGEGTGLGLAVVHGIVRDHDGAIYIDSRVGSGTSIEVFLPEHLGEASVARVAPTTFPRGNSERILVVDDEEALCSSLTHLLSRMGYQVVAKSRPEAALELFRQEPDSFALVLTDLTMPGMTGLQLAQELLALRPATRVALMSGFSGTWTPASVRTLGLVDMLVKPLSAAALAEGVARALSGASVQDS